MDLTVRDWEKIGRSPVLVFLAVAKADSSISGQEVASYAEDFLPRVQDFEVSTIDHDRSVFQWAIKDAAREWRTLADGHLNDLLDELEETIGLIDARFRPGAAKAWKSALLELGHGVASASGGFLGLTDKVNQAERDVLQRLDRMLEDRPVL